MAEKLLYSGRAGSGKTFLLKMARNVSLEELRVSGKTDFTDSLSSSYDEPSYSERDITDGLYIDELMKCLNGNECKIIVLYYYSQLTFKEIADVLSLPKSTVKWRHDRALDKLRAAAGM